MINDFSYYVRIRSLAIFVAWIPVIISGTDVYPQVWSTETGRAEFVSSIPLYEFTGASEYLAGRISLPDSTIDFYLDLESLKTGNGKRDKDMRQTLGTTANPFAEFFGKLQGVVDPEVNGVYPVMAVGDFTINGITNQVSIAGQIKVSGQDLIVTASWYLLLEEYKISPPEFLFLKVDQKQKISLSATLMRTKE